MKVFDPVAYKNMVRDFQERDEPLGWFDSIYSDAEGDFSAVFWADLEASPYLTQWLKENPLKAEKKSAIAIGCGVGDDAEEMANYGFDVTAFDIAPTAIELCKNRYTQSKVKYLVADLFDYPKTWQGRFDLVYECNTIQVLPGKYRKQAMQAMVSLLAKGGTLLVSCRSRKSGEQEEDIPLPLDKIEIDTFKSMGLKEEHFLAYDDSQEPPVPHFFVAYTKE
ncbi:MAG: methyltransferase domain-containing protein [Sulfurovum sp.]|nr:methyltransferase domain-containing protein [Sulfurovum sp.]